MKKKLASKNNAAVAADMEQTIVQGINCTNFTCNFASVGSTAPAPRVLQVLADFVSSGAEVEHVYISEMESLAPLCDALAASPFLSELFLAHASCISVHKLPAEVARIAKGSASLRELTIYDSIVGAAWKSVLPEVLSGRFLTSLVFSQCRLGDNNTEIIASAFSSGQRGLTDLDLSNNCIAETGSKAIAAGIITRTPLRTLNLYANMIGDTGAAAIGETLANPYCVLRKLNLGQNGVSPVGIKPLAKALRQNSQLEKLVLGPNDLGDAGAELLAEALSRGTRSCLRRLDLRANVITEAGARRIAEMGLQPRGLEKLNLRENSVGVDGCKLIGTATAGLISLKLGSNEINDKAAMELVRGIAKGTSLRKLDLGGNPKIGGKGATEVSRMLMKSESLTDLNLSGCHLDDKGLVPILKAARKINRIVKLNLSGSHPGNASLKALGELLPTDTALRELVLQSFYLSPGQLDVLSQALQSRIEQNSAPLTIRLSKENVNGLSIMRLRHHLNCSPTVLIFD